MRTLLFFAILLAAIAMLGSSGDQVLLAQQQPAPQHPQAQPPSPNKGPDPDATVYPPWVEWLKSVLTWWLLVPIVALALALWFSRISTSPSRDPSRDMR